MKEGKINFIRCYVNNQISEKSPRRWLLKGNA
jgi:hypothetical protein